MESNYLLELKLQVLREFQDMFPGAHVGGSIGLLIHGINVGRDLSKSDLDITVPEEIDIYSMPRSTQGSEGCDFDYQITVDRGPFSGYAKIDVRICPEPSFIILSYKGDEYNVSLLRDILFWKKKYADNGVQKHRDDLVCIDTGIRPSIIHTPSSIWNDLPFKD